MREAAALGFPGRPATAAAAFAAAQPLLMARAELTPLPAGPALPAVPMAAPPGRCRSTRLTLGALTLAASAAAAARGPGRLAGAGRLVPSPCGAHEADGCLEAAAAPGCLAVLPQGAAGAGRGMCEPKLAGVAAAPAPAEPSRVITCTGWEASTPKIPCCCCCCRCCRCSAAQLAWLALHCRCSAGS